MKIGIVTYHRNHNYGAIYQAVATRLIFQKMGHEVYYIDYTPYYINEYYSLLSIKEFISRGPIGSFVYLKDVLTNFSARKRRIEKFRIFIEEHIAPFCKPIDEEFDMVLYGSDQIWRKQRKLKGYDPFYYGMNSIKTKLSIAFAASMGALPSNNGDKLLVKKMLSHINIFSVREISLLNFLKDIGVDQVYLLPDPTLLVEGYQIWDHEVPVKKQGYKKYVLLYDLQPGAFDYSEIDRISQKNEMDLIVISGDSNKRKKGINIPDAGPQEFIDLIRGASFVFTSSFHGIVFSLIYNKSFFASFKKNAGRAESLLEQLNLIDRILPISSKISQLTDINYEEVSSAILRIRSQSCSFYNILQQQFQD